MLDQYDQSELAKKIAALACDVRVPAELLEQFERSGPASTVADERRRYPRFFCPASRTRAGMFCEATFPALPRQPAWYGVLVADISRGGLRLLHSEPLFPRQRVRIVIAREEQPLDLSAEVVRCRRLDARCFEIGVCFSIVEEST